MFEYRSNDKPFFVLMTADCVSDVVTINRVIDSLAPGFREHWVPDGRELLKYLTRSGKYADRLLYPEPDLVLFSDENSAVCSFRVLRIAKRYKLSKRVPFVLLSGSTRDSERQLARRLGARLFVQQPVDKRRFSEQLISLKEVCGRAA